MQLHNEPLEHIKRIAKEVYGEVIEDDTATKIMLTMFENIQLEGLIKESMIKRIDLEGWGWKCKVCQHENHELKDESIVLPALD